MADVNISKYRASVVREGSTPASPGFVVSDGQNPVDPSGSGQNHLPVTIAEAATGLSITESQVLGGAGTVGQYIRGDGSLADFPESSGGGSSVSYYLNGSVNQGTIGGIAYKELNKVPILGAGTDFTINADGYIASFITDAGDPNLLEIPGGNWNFETYFSASSGGGSPTFYVELYKVNSGGTATLIASNSTFPELIAFGTNVNAYFSTLAVPTTTLALTDRLAIRYYVNHSGRTITLHTEDNHLCQIITTFTTGITALNGLTAQVQNLAVGTSGTDFNIASAIATHTFNLPTASATNRGALSSADWTIFNNKQNALTNPVTGTGTTNYLPKFTGASTIGNSNIQDSGSLVSVGVATNFSSTVTAANNFLVNNPSASKKGYTYQSPSSNWGPQVSGLYFTPNNGIDAKTTFSIELWNGVGSIITPLTITDEGKVGIGTTTPDSGLQISSGATRGLRVDVNSGVQAISISPNGIFGIDEPALGNGRFIVNTNGKVGIGTNVPSERLHIAGVGSALAFDTTGAVANNLISTVEDFKLSLKCLRGTSSEIKIGNSNLEFFTNSNPRITVFSDGNTFIGPSPTNNGARLQVSGRGTFTAPSGQNALVVNGVNSIFAQNIIAGTGTSTSFGLTISAGTNSSDIAFQIYNAAENAVRLFVRGDGNVGIGTASPGAKLVMVGNSGQLNGNYRFNAQFLQDQTTARGIGFGFKSDEQLGLIYGETASAPSNLAFMTYSGSAFLERMRITSGGNVLIGTQTDSGHKLRVNGTALISSNYNNFQTSSKTASSGGTITFNYNTDYNTGSDGDNTGGIIIINVNEASTNVANGNAVYIGTVINPRGGVAIVTQISRTLGSGITALTVSSSANNITVTSSVGSGGNFRATLTFIGGAGIS